MTIQDLGNALNANQSGYVFKHFGWSKNPDGDYGVYAEDSASELNADGISGVEERIEGTIDYFTRDDTGTPKSVIQGILKNLKIWWTLNDVQYEDDTGYIHYEWVFKIYG